MSHFDQSRKKKSVHGLKCLLSSIVLEHFNESGESGRTNRVLSVMKSTSEEIEENRGWDGTECDWQSTAIDDSISTTNIYYSVKLDTSFFRALSPRFN